MGVAVVMAMGVGVALAESSEADDHQLHEEEYDDGHEHDCFNPGVLRDGTG